MGSVHIKLWLGILSTINILDATYLQANAQIKNMDLFSIITAITLEHFHLSIIITVSLMVETAL